MLQKCSKVTYKYEYPPDCLHPTVDIDILLRTRAAMHTTIAAAHHTKSFPWFPNQYFNISGLLPCCKKKFLVFLWGPLFCGGPCSAEHA